MTVSDVIDHQKMKSHRMILMHVYGGKGIFGGITKFYPEPM